MVNKKISELDPAATITGTEIVPLLQAGATKAATVGQLLALLTAAAPGNLDTFFEVATQMGLDEATVTTLQALVAGKADTATVAATYATGASVVVAAADSLAIGARFRCDGTDDQATINAAIGTLPANGGKVLLLAGTYYLSGSVIINRRSVVLTGEGMGFWNEYVDGMPTASAGEGLGMTKLKATTSTFPLVKVDNTVMSASGPDARLNGIEIAGLYLYGASKTDPSSVGIYCLDDGRPTDMLHIHDVFCHNVYDGMILGADSPDIHHNSIQDIGHDGISFPQYGSSNPSGTWTTVYPNIHENVIADIGGDCIAIGVQATGAILHHNILARGQRGIISTAPSTLVSENQFIDNGAEACYLLGAGPQAVNNQFQNQSHTSIRLDATPDPTVLGNQIRSTATGTHAITLTGCTSVNVASNNIRLISGTATSSAIGGTTLTGIITGNIARGYTTGYAIPTGDGTNLITTGNLSLPDGGGTPPAGSITDNFTRPDDATTLGGTWTPLTGTWGITANQAYIAVGPAQNYAVQDIGISDVTVQATPTGSATGDQGLCFRMQDQNNGYLAVFNESGSVKFYNIVSNGFTQIGAAAVAVATGDVMKVTAAGSTLTLFKNGSQVLQVTDTTWPTGTKHGLWGYGVTGAGVRVWDDFSLTA